MARFVHFLCLSNRQIYNNEAQKMYLTTSLILSLSFSGFSVSERHPLSWQTQVLGQSGSYRGAEGLSAM